MEQAACLRTTKVERIGNSDVCSCSNNFCPSRSDCYRHPDSGTVFKGIYSVAQFEVPEGQDRCAFFKPVRRLPREEEYD